MQIPIEVLFEALVPFGKVSLHANPDLQISGVRVGQSRGKKGFAYVIAGDDAQDPEDPRILVAVGRPKIPNQRYIEILADHPSEIFTALQDLFEQLQELESQLSVYEAKKDYTGLLQTAAQRIGDSVRLFDQNHHLHATSKRSYEDDTANFIDSMQELSNEGELEYMMSLHKPTVCMFRGCKLPCIVSNIYDRGIRRGHILVICSKKEPSAQTRFICSLLLEHLRRMISEDRAFGYIRTEEPLYNTLYHYLTGSEVENNQITELFSTTLGWNSGYYCVLQMIDLGSRASFSYLSQELGELFPATCVLLKGSLCAVLHLEQWRPVQQMKDTLASFLEKNALRGTISPLFRDCANLRFWAEQTKMIGERSKQCVSAIADHQLDMLIESLSEEQKKLLDSSLLDYLTELDEQTGSEYYQTLKTWLDNDCAIDQTASALFIHRNTLRYRLDHLEEIMGTDFKNPLERLLLQISFYIRRADPIDIGR